MFDQPQSGYILPQDFTVVSTVFDKVVSVRGISRQSEESECLARYALRLFMTGTRDALDLEASLKEACPSFDYPVPGSGKDTTVVELLPELSAWARSLSDSQSEARALTEQTLEYAIDHVEDFIATSDLRAWLVRLMVELHLGRLRRDARYSDRAGKPRSRRSASRQP